MNIVFSGPSGAGKGTLTEMFLKDSIIIFITKKPFCKR